MNSTFLLPKYPWKNDFNLTGKFVGKMPEDKYLLEADLWLLSEISPDN